MILSLFPRIFCFYFYNLLKMIYLNLCFHSLIHHPLFPFPMSLSLCVPIIRISAYTVPGMQMVDSVDLSVVSPGLPASLP